MADTIFAGVRLAILFGGSGFLFTLGCIFACRWLKWAPINITVNFDSVQPEGGKDRP